MTRAADGTIIQFDPPLTWRERLADIAHCVASLTVATAFTATCVWWGIGIAHGHEAPTGWAYGRECCDNRDCQMIEPTAVIATTKGWQVTLRPGEHRFAQQSQTWTVPYGDRREKRSGDGDFHACLLPLTGGLLCLYVPEMGM